MYIDFRYTVVYSGCRLGRNVFPMPIISHLGHGFVSSFFLFSHVSEEPIKVNHRVTSARSLKDAENCKALKGSEESRSLEDCREHVIYGPVRYAAGLCPIILKHGRYPQLCTLKETSVGATSLFQRAVKAMHLTGFRWLWNLGVVLNAICRLSCSKS